MVTWVKIILQQWIFPGIKKDISLINESINQLLQYGLNTGLIEKEDKVYIANKITR